jgi:hypothetical protein
MDVPTARPLVPHNEGKLRPPSGVAWVKGDTSKLRGEGSLAPLKMNLFVLIVQLIMLSEDIHSRMTSVGSDRPDKLINLNNRIQCEMVQLHSKFAKNIHKD